MMLMTRCRVSGGASAGARIDRMRRWVARQWLPVVSRATGATAGPIVSPGREFSILSSRSLVPIFDRTSFARNFAVGRGKRRETGLAAAPVNGAIRVPGGDSGDVRLIAEDGAQLGVVPLSEALSSARTHNLDLVEINAKAKPPVVRMVRLYCWREGVCVCACVCVCSAWVRCSRSEFERCEVGLILLIFENPFPRWTTVLRYTASVRRLRS